MKRLLVFLSLAGCFPYRELYRPDIDGAVVDRDSRPVAGVEVKTCSYSRWQRPTIDCPRQASSTTDLDGGFHFDRLKEWEWCCLGEAPMPQTEVFVCTPDGGAGATVASGGKLVLQLGEGSPRCVEP